MKNFFWVVMASSFLTVSVYADTPYDGSEAATLLQGTSSDGFLSQADLVKVSQELAAIRAQFPDTVLVRARSRWVPNHLVLSLRPDAQELFLQTNASTSDGRTVSDHYLLPSFETGVQELDQLNDILGVSSIQFYQQIPVSGRPSITLDLEFAGDMDLPKVTQFYQALESVAYAFPSYYMGDGSNVYRTPEVSPGVDGYVFKAAAGDCLAGCINRSYGYFLVDRATLRATQLSADSRLAQRLKRSN